MRKFMKAAGKSTRLQKMRALAASVFIAIIPIMAPAPLAYAAGGGKIKDAAEKASEGIVGTLQDILPYILSVVVGVIGISLIVSSARQKEEQKENAPSKIVGIVFVACAASLATAMVAWMK